MVKEQKKVDVRSQLWGVAIVNDIVILVAERPAGGGADNSHCLVCVIRGF
jgi:hypothetical protein